MVKKSYCCTAKEQIVDLVISIISDTLSGLMFKFDGFDFIWRWLDM